MEMEADQPKEERKKIYTRTRNDLLIRNLSNSEKYDNAILTLSTGVLGISLAFIKDIVPLDKAQYVILLKASWWVLGASIVSTLVSFVLSQLAIKRQLEYAEQYYLEEKDEYLYKKNCPALWTEFVNYASGILFIVGILTSICFVSVNIQGGNTMARDIRQSVKDGATIPTLEKIGTAPAKKGATIPSMEPVKPAPSTRQQSGSQSGEGAEKTKE